MEKQVKKMGFWSIFLLGITGIIGSGIFLLPSQATAQVGVASIFVFIFDALLILCIALCFAKAATYFEKDGGPYLYAKDAFGDFVGFEVGFVTWAIRIIAEATMAVAFTTALSAIFPYFATVTGKMIVVTLFVVILAAMNIAGVGLSKIVINLVTVSKLVPLLLFIAVGIFFIKGANFTPIVPSAHISGHTWASVAMLLFYAFTGIEAVGVAAGDMKHPKRDIPRALISITLAVAVIYILIQTVSIGILGQSTLAKSAVPIQDAFATVAGGFGKSIVAAGTLLSTGGLLIASSYVTPRSGVALAEGDMMPKVVAKRNRRNAPWVAIVVSATLTLTIAYSGSFAQLALISAVSRFAQYIPTCLAVIVYSKTKKGMESSFHLPFGPIIPALAVIVSLYLLSQVKTENLLWGLGALGIAVPFYFLMKALNPKATE
ncbi:MAG: APC family permease [Streptococcaceae bacterium]|jgi:amino acid transporter|nr:APC family permease [Streptococcaceae bacterium]